MQLLRLDNGELRITVIDRFGDTMEVQSHLGEEQRYVTIRIYDIADIEGAAKCAILSQRKIRELVPHLVAFGETGQLEVRDG